jgi:hypothetical protein
VLDCRTVFNSEREEMLRMNALDLRVHTIRCESDDDSKYSTSNECVSSSARST